jgi:putative PIN family toxin of toxin-antitoxin system
MPFTARAVIDINLFVSGLMGASATRALIDAWRAHKFVLAVSDRFLSELIEVLNRPKFNRYFTREDVQELVSLILVPFQLSK